MKCKQYFSTLLLGIFFACSTEKDHLIKIETRHGDMYAVLYDQTPEHKKNFIRLVKEQRFDSTTFHRVIRDFMIQAGDVFTKEGIPPEEWYTIPAEFNDQYFHERGSIAAARQGDGINPAKQSSGSQFYIVQGIVYDELELTTDMPRLQQTFMKFVQVVSNKHLMEEYSRLYQEGDFKGLNKLMLSYKSEMESFFNTSLSKKMNAQQLSAYTSVGGTPHLDGEYTVFGKIIQGMEVVDKIASVKTSAQDIPLDPVYIRVTVQEKLKKDIAEEFGYTYPTENE
jgi:peptidyl-prolyl cis-trans isomerase B (cyclophilin B)